MADEQFTSAHAIDVKAGFDPSKLRGKSVVVTGGASGLGEEMVRQFVQAGAFVTIGDLSEERSAAIANELGKEKCTYAQTDVLSWSSQLALFKHALATSPTNSIDIVVANAGISGPDAVWRAPETPATATSPDPQEPDLSILKVNLVGVHYTAQLAIHYLSHAPAGTDRSLILTASLAGYLDMPGAPQYGASKWGVRGLLHSLRRTLPAQELRVNMIAPWFIGTPIMSAEVQALLRGRGIAFAEKADAGKAVLHLAADERVNGRALAILPREECKEGYRDLGLEDFDEGEVLTGLMKATGMVRHRIEAK